MFALEALGGLFLVVALGAVANARSKGRTHAKHSFVFKYWIAPLLGWIRAFVFNGYARSSNAQKRIGAFDVDRIDVKCR